MNKEKEKEEPPKPRRRVKKVRGHGGHHGGAWKVAYADFVTAMMALFLVLWLVSQADIKLKQAIANYFRAPGVFDTVQGGILSQAKKVSQEPNNLTAKDDEQMLFNTAQKLKEKFESRPEFSKYKEQVKIEVTDEGLRIQLVDQADRVSFPSGNAELTSEAKAILEVIAADICNLPNKINIGGHTDRRVFAGADGYSNWELSTDRANAARRFLQGVCVPPDQIQRIIGFADTVPMIPNDPYAAANRRISITVLRLTMAGEAAAPDAPARSAPSVNVPVGPPNPQPSGKKPDAEKTSANDLINDPEVRSKLMNQGSVSVGEPDEVPKVSKSKSAAPPEH